MLTVQVSFWSDMIAIVRPTAQWQNIWSTYSLARAKGVWCKTRMRRTRRIDLERKGIAPSLLSVISCFLIILKISTFYHYHVIESPREQGNISWEHIFRLFIQVVKN